jgi:3-isopropylmalate/(R)-2-methylmalate dehydratase small subunit
LEAETIDELFAQATGPEALRLAVDLPAQTLSVGPETIRFQVDPFRKHCLIEGLDDIGLTLQHVDAIRAYEERRHAEAPWLFA